MPASRSPRRAAFVLCAILMPVALAACGTATSTGNYKGAEHEVAQAVANFQADSSAGEQDKVCSQDLSARIVASLGGTAGCRVAIKNQLGQVDNFELAIQSIKLGTATTATATVRSIYSGQKVSRTLALVKEAGGWRIASLL